MSTRLLFSFASAASKQAASALRTSTPSRPLNCRIPHQPVQFLQARYSSTETEEATATTATTTTTATETSDDTPPPTPTPNPTSDNGKIVTGAVRFFFRSRHYGFIVPDGVHKDDKQNHIFIHRDQINGQKVTLEDNSILFPMITRGMRVQFKLGPPKDGKGAKTALDLNLEGGKPPPLHLKKFARGNEIRQKGKLGVEVFDVLESSTSQEEMESRIVAAYERTKESIERTNRRMEEAEKILKEGKNSEGSAE